MAHHYNADEDVLNQACNSEEIPRGPDPVWYVPIKNMDTLSLDAILSDLDLKEREQLFGWENAAQWTWQIRTALGYAIWRGNLAAVKTLLAFGADVKETVAQEESSSVHYDGGIQFSSLAYCVHCGNADAIPLLLAAGATKQDWLPDSLYNFPRNPTDGVVPSAFWRSGGIAVSDALDGSISP